MEKKYFYNFCSQNFTILWLLQGRLKNINLSNNLLLLKEQALNVNTRNVVGVDKFCNNFNDNNILDYYFSFLLEKHTIVEEYIEINNLKFKKNFLDSINYNFVALDKSKLLGNFTTPTVEYENQFFMNNTSTNLEYYFEYLYRNSIRFLFYFFIPFFFYSLFEFFILFLIFFKFFNWVTIFDYYGFNSTFFLYYTDMFLFFIPTCFFYDNIVYFSIFSYIFFIFYWVLFVFLPIYRNFVSSFGSGYSMGGIDLVYDEDNLWSLEPDKDLLGYEFSLISTPTYFFYLNFISIFFCFYFYLLNEIYIYLFDLFVISLNFFYFIFGFYNILNFTSHIYFLNIFLYFILFFIGSFILFYMIKFLEHYRLNKRKYGVEDSYKGLINKPITIFNILYQNVLSISKFLAIRDVWLQNPLVNLNYVYLKVLYKFFLLLFKISSILLISLGVVFYINNNFITLINFNNIFFNINNIDLPNFLNLIIFVKYYIYILYIFLNNLYKGIYIFFSIFFFYFYYWKLVICYFYNNIYFVILYFYNFIYQYLSDCIFFNNLILSYFKFELLSIKKYFYFFYKYLDIELYNLFFYKINYISDYIFFYKLNFGIILSSNLCIYLFSIILDIFIFLYQSTFKYIYVLIYIYILIFFNIFIIKKFFYSSFEYNFFNWLKARKSLNLKNLTIYSNGGIFYSNIGPNLKLIRRKNLTFLAFVKFKRYINFLNYVKSETIKNNFKSITRLKYINIYLYLRRILLALPFSLFYRFKRFILNLNNILFIFNLKHLYLYLFESSTRIKKLIEDDKSYNELLHYKKIYGENSDLFVTEDHKMPIFIFLNNEYTLICVIIYTIYDEN